VYSRVLPLFGRDAQKTLKGSSKLVVENGVDDRVEEAVDVAEPDEEREEDRVEATDAGQLEQVVADTRGVDDVECEERNPAEQKHPCISSRNRIIIIIIIIMYPGLQHGLVKLLSAAGSKKFFCYFQVENGE